MTSTKNIAEIINEMTEAAIRQELAGLTITELQQLARETKTPIARDKRRKADIIEIFASKFAVETEEVAQVEPIADEVKEANEIGETTETTVDKESISEENKDEIEMMSEKTINMQQIAEVKLEAQIMTLIISSIAVLCSIFFCKVEAMPVVLILSNSIILLASVMLITETPGETIESKVATIKTNIFDKLVILKHRVPGRIIEGFAYASRMISGIKHILLIVCNKIILLIDRLDASGVDSVTTPTDDNIDYSVFEKFLCQAYLHLETL